MGAADSAAVVPLRVVGGLMIGTRERIVLVEIGDTWIVVGLVPGQIRTLHTLPKGDLKPAGEWRAAFCAVAETDHRAQE
jgi:flagellar biogenesis protein FliO